MIKKTIQASAFGKKTYAKPQMKAYQMQINNIICTSDTKTQNDEPEDFQYGGKL